MQLLPLDKLGTHEPIDRPGVIDFGVLLPGITASDGTLYVRIIHERDQFIQAIPPVEVPLAHSQLAGFGDYWSGSVDTFDMGLKPAGALGWGRQDGEQRYIYRYVLKRNGAPDIDDIIDPFAREYGVGDLSAITVGYQPFVFDPIIEEQTFKVPAIRDAIVYELNIAELGGDLPKTIGLLDYIADLGVNVIEVMPVSNVASRIDWGYAPLGYLGVDERFGKRRDFQHFVAEAHRLGIAVVVDSVFGHVEDRFPYHRLYTLLGRASPFTGPYAENLFFQSTDFAQSLTQDFFLTVCAHWLEKFHVDGFRYDAVSQFWDEHRLDGDQGFADLAEAVREYVSSQAGAPGHYQRFFSTGGGELALIQIAEYLSGQNPPEHVLYDTMANSAWQNQTLDAAKRCARGEPGALTEFGWRLGLPDFPILQVQDGVSITKSALQYIENHDHERFICNFGTHFPDEDSRRRNDQLLRIGDRDQRWYKVQPYLIGLLTAKGTPLLWQGQEFCQNYFVPDEGIGRVAIYRPVDFNFFYDPIGKAMIRLVRKLTRIRRGGAQFREGGHFFYGDPQYTNKGLLLFHRRLNLGATEIFSLVALNFTDHEQRATFTFPLTGDYLEQIEGQRNLPGVSAGSSREVSVPSNYGCIWTVNGA